MSYLLDTTVLIDHAAGRFGATELLERLFGETGDIFVCDATMAEALSGGTAAEVDLIARVAQAFEYVATTPDAARQKPGAGGVVAGAATSVTRSSPESHGAWGPRS